MIGRSIALKYSRNAQQAEQRPAQGWRDRLHRVIPWRINLSLSLDPMRFIGWSFIQESL